MKSLVSSSIIFLSGCFFQQKSWCRPAFEYNIILTGNYCIIHLLPPKAAGKNTKDSSFHKHNLSATKYINILTIIFAKCVLRRSAIAAWITLTFSNPGNILISHYVIILLVFLLSFVCVIVCCHPGGRTGYTVFDK